MAPDGHASRSSTIGERFDRICSEYGRRTAIEDPDGACSYAALQEDAHRWASRLGAYGEAPRPVAIVMPRGRHLVAAILGAAISGTPWTVVPHGAHLAMRRTLLALGPCLLIADEIGSELAAAIEGLDIRRLDPTARDAGGSRVAVSAPAGITFTSGSTGAPKGVVLRHDSTVVNAGIAFASLGLSPEDRYLWLSALDSTATNTAIFAPLLNGACLVPFDVGDHGFSALADWIAQARCTILHCIPGLFRRFVRAVGDIERLGSLEVVKLGGETAFQADADLFEERLPSRARLFNGLGMSEANGNVCHERLRRDERFADVLPIGRPLPGFALALVDAGGSEVAPGEAGRLRISGHGLAAGYWDAEAGKVLPFAASADGRTFQTEDWCRRREDGRFVHLGRSDGVVKVRGRRVALAAVESALRSIDGIAEAVVQPVRDRTGEMGIRAWIEPDGDRTLDPILVREQLGKCVAPEAVPARLHLVEKLPLLAGGKLDRAGLFGSPLEVPATEAAEPHPAQDLDLARMSGFFAHALNRPAFASDADFFDDGGDSLAAATLAALVEEEWQCFVDPGVLAANPTPRALLRSLSADHIRPAYRLSSAGSGPPLWIAGGAGDPIFSLLPFARALHGHGPIYGYATGLDRFGQPALRLSDMTDPVLEVVLRVQPHGPYLLAGTSFGGWLAFDLAVRLRAMDREVAFLGMIDASGPGYPAFRANVPMNVRRLHWERNFFRRYYPDTRSGRVSKRAIGLARRLRTWQRLLAGSDANRIGLLEKTWLVEEACLRARRRYPVGRYDGTISAFQAESPLRDYYREDAALGWRSHSDRPVRTYPITGNHGLHMKPPNAAGLARTLVAAINETLAW